MITINSEKVLKQRCLINNIILTALIINLDSDLVWRFFYVQNNCLKKGYFVVENLVLNVVISCCVELVYDDLLGIPVE